MYIEKLLKIIIFIDYNFFLHFITIKQFNKKQI